MEKILGKITNAEYGIVRDYPFLMGLNLQFKLADGCGIGSGGFYTYNMNPACKWEGGETEKNKILAESLEFIYKILRDANVDNISELKDIPVEVTIDRNTFKDFRILTEVI